MAFLLLALLLALFSGDVLLVFAVGTAVAGIALLALQRSLVGERRHVSKPAPVRATPVVSRPSRPASVRPATRARMAVRRHPAPSQAPRARTRSAHTPVSESPGQVQVIQVLQ